MNEEELALNNPPYWYAIKPKQTQTNQEGVLIV